MKVAIIGIPKSGKTTIFNALTKGKAEVAAYSPTLAPNTGVAKVPIPDYQCWKAYSSPKRLFPQR